MTRRNFTKDTKRKALERADGKCEGGGTLYGFDPGVRCNRDLAYGVHFDHVDTEAVSHDNSLENCAAVCPPCNMHKAHTYDTQRAAKTKRQGDKDRGITKPKRPWPSRGFGQRFEPRVRQIQEDV